ncbi:MAG: hypothetical protein Q9174_004281 [Haloplaca sp. 1 TL-2023]
MSNLSRSPGPRNPATASSSFTGTGRSSPVRTSNGIARSARGSVKKPSSNTNRLSAAPNVSEDPQEVDARAEQASLLEELRNRVKNAEELSEDYQRQLKALQSRLDESSQEHDRLENHMHEREARVVELESQAKQVAREKRELEASIESERNAMSREQAEQKGVEEELRAGNQRLKDTIADRDLRNNEQVMEGDVKDQAAAGTSSHLDIPEEHEREKRQKDKVIEALRLELAGSQIKMMEVENAGGSRLQELEKSMMETRIANARLMEENESFQLLLSEKTLSGDFSKTDVMQPSSGLGSLAEELESAEGESENYRRLEIEAKSLKDQNKALTLYIENIIGRLLSHKEFENVLEKSPDLMSSIAKPSAVNSSNMDKELPPPPPPKDDEPAPSLLQRAKSVVGGPRRPRPMSFMAPSAAQATPTDEDSSHSTSVSMTRSASARARQESHRRSQSEMPMAAPIVNQMYRGPTSTGSGGPLSPGISPGVGAARNPFFTSTTGTGGSNATSRAPSGSRFSQERPESSSNSTFSDKSGDQASKDKSKSGYTNYTGAVMTQSRLRPLRLVQENRELEGGSEEANRQEETAARKKANRTSWMPGWFNRGKEEEVRGSGAENSNFF